MKARWNEVESRLIRSVLERAGTDPVAYDEAYQDILNSGQLRETLPDLDSA